MAKAQRLSHRRLAQAHRPRPGECAAVPGGETCERDSHRQGGGAQSLRVAYSGSGCAGNIHVSNQRALQRRPPHQLQGRGGVAGVPARGHTSSSIISPPKVLVPPSEPLPRRGGATTPLLGVAPRPLPRGVPCSRADGRVFGAGRECAHVQRHHGRRLPGHGVVGAGRATVPGFPAALPPPALWGAAWAVPRCPDRGRGHMSDAR
mmetsp:Transcript_15519/g.36053  ORF Transcript_15519/g.36053 Transcript_15519/m.36053 type:complete len:205 (+) Transcript_15519:706-1320(+)